MNPGVCTKHGIFGFGCEKLVWTPLIAKHQNPKINFKVSSFHKSKGVQAEKKLKIYEKDGNKKAEIGEKSIQRMKNL